MSETATSQPAQDAPAATITTQATQATPAPSPESAPAQPAAQPAQAQPAQEPVYALTLPQDSLLEASAVERMTTFAKDGKLAPETAQKALEWTHAEILAHEQRKVDDYKAKVASWEQTVKTDKDLGGEHHTRTLTRVKAAMDRYAKDRPEKAAAFKQALNTSGFGNHPGFVDMVEYFGAAMEADSIPKPGASVQPDGSYLDRMFPTSAGK